MKQIVLAAGVLFALLTGCQGAPPASPRAGTDARLAASVVPTTRLAASVVPTTRPAAVAGRANLLALGDWGMDTPDRQTVADAMGAYVVQSGQRFDATLLLGDNFYTKLKSADDPLFPKLFERTYDAARLNFPFYALLGNHDYQEDKAAIEQQYARLHPDSRFKLPSRWYRLDLPAGDPVVTVLMLDSNQEKMSKKEWQAQIDWIDAELSKPHAPWTMCCAHHELFSNGQHGDIGVLQTEWGPVFKKDHLDFYLCGHDHTMQHLEIDGWPISFVVSGGGGGARRPMLKDQRGPFSRATLGFAHFQFDRDAATVRLLDGDGKPLHEFVRDRAGAVWVVTNTPSQAATTHPLKTIQGFDDEPKGASRPSPSDAPR